MCLNRSAVCAAACGEVSSGYQKLLSSPASTTGSPLTGAAAAGGGGMALLGTAGSHLHTDISGSTRCSECEAHSSTAALCAGCVAPHSAPHLPPRLLGQRASQGAGPWMCAGGDVCPFSRSLCWFPLLCEDESQRCHHVVLWRKGRAVLLTVPVLCSALPGPGALPVLPVSRSTGVPGTAISSGLTLAEEGSPHQLIPALCPGGPIPGGEGVLSAAAGVLAAPL